MSFIVEVGISKSDAKVGQIGTFGIDAIQQTEANGRGDRSVVGRDRRSKGKGQRLAKSESAKWAKKWTEGERPREESGGRREMQKCRV